MRLALAAATSLLAATAAAQGTVPSLGAWLQGEWNNHEQVWQQRLDVADPKVTVKPVPVAHRHTIVAPLPAASAATGTLLYVQRAAGEDAKQIDGQWLLHLGSLAPDGTTRVRLVRLTKDAARWADAHRKPQLAAALAQAGPGELGERSAGDCELVLHFDPQAQAFATRELPGGRCREAAGALGEPWQLSAAGQWTTGSGATAARARKVRYFEGWVWFRNAGPAAAADDKDTSFAAKLLVHSEGQRIPLMRKDGSASPWLLELAQLTYQNTRVPILKFALVDAASGKSIAYTWVNTEATRVGMNLGWFQSGLTQRSERVHFGF
jgi:hypothetical protein